MHTNRFFQKFYFKWVLLGALSVVIRSYVPQVAIYGAGHDDELMVALAHNLLNGEWLGNYSDLVNRTLAKPPGYPFFLVIAFVLRVPSTVLIQVFIVFFSALLFKNLVKSGVDQRIAEIGYCAMIFSPVWFSPNASRIYRDYFLACLMLAVIAGSMNLLNRIKLISANTNTDWRRILKLVGSSFLVGLVLSWVRVTKNITFSGFILVLIVVFLGIFSMKRRLKNYVILILCTLVTILSSYLIMPVAVSSMNDRVYGVNLTNNYTEGTFADAMKIMASVKDTRPRQYVVISKAMRMKMYAVSPTFRKISPFIESQENVDWKVPPCQSPLKICDESAAWFPWEIRDGVVLAGLGDTAIEFENTFKMISEEVEAGCRYQFLECGQQGLATGIGPLGGLSIRHVIESHFAAGNEIFNLVGGDGLSASYATGISDETLRMWDETVRYLPKNAPLNSYLPGVNAGSDTVALISNIYKRMWPYFLILGLSGYLCFRPKKYNLDVFIIGLGSLIAATSQVSQLAIAEASIGLFVRGAAGYYFPIYPFLIVACTIGIDILIARARLNLKMNSVVNT